MAVTDTGMSLPHTQLYIAPTATATARAQIHIDIHYYLVYVCIPLLLGGECSRGARGGTRAAVGQSRRRRRGARGVDWAGI